MLQTIRNKAQSPFIQGIVLIIAVVFVFWGVGANMNNREAALVINDDEISFQRYRQVYDQAVNDYSEQFGGTIPKGFLDMINVKQQVINQLIQESLLRQGATDMGIQTSGDEVQNEIRSMSQFQENSAFNMDRYKSILASNRYTPNKFELSIRHDMLSGKAIKNISAFGSTITAHEVEDLYRLEKESVTLQFVRLSSDAFLEQISPSEIDLNSFFESNKENYKTEPQVKLKYLLFSTQDLASQLVVDSDTIKERYEKGISTYQIAETRHARHILLSAAENDPEELHEKQRQKAEEILKLAKVDNNFAKLAEKYSEGPSGKTGGDLGIFGRGQMVGPFDNAVFLLQAGEISDVVKTKFGYHIIKLEGINPARTKTLDDVRDSIAKTIRLEQAKPLTFQKANSTYEGIIAAGSLPAYGEAHPEITVHETEMFSHSTPPATLRKQNLLLDKAFQLNKGELSSLIETPSGYAILFATDTQEPALPVLNDVKAKVTGDYKQEKAAEKARETAENLLAALKQGGDFEKETTALGLEIENSGPLLKTGDNTGSIFPASLVDQSFTLSRFSPYPDQPALVGNTYYLFKFLKRQIPDTQLTDTDRKKYSDILLDMKQKRLISAWLKMVEKEAKIFTSKDI